MLRRALLRLITICLLAGAFGPVLVTPAAAQPAALPVCGSWRLVVVPGLPPRSMLSAVAATAANDVWAVGGANSDQDPMSMWTHADPLLLHWDGARWQVIMLPSPGRGQTTLGAVAAHSRSDVWVLGEYKPGVNQSQPVVFHWDGRRWTEVARPAVAGQHLAALAVPAAGEAWLVGLADLGSRFVLGDRTRTLILRWTGHDWQEVPAPNPGTLSNGLQTITATGRNDIWAMGLTSSPSSLPPSSQMPGTLVLHWDGTRWTNPSTPLQGSAWHALALAPNNFWAASTTFQEGGSTISSGHWNGQTWTAPAIPLPPPVQGGMPEVEINSLAARGPSDLWAAGSFAYSDRLNATRQRKTLITQWDGTRWFTIPSPNVSEVQNHLNGITAVPGGGLWAVGGTQDDQGLPRNALILRYIPAVCRTR